MKRVQFETFKYISDDKEVSINLFSEQEEWSAESDQAVTKVQLEKLGIALSGLKNSKTSNETETAKIQSETRVLEDQLQNLGKEMEGQAENQNENDIRKFEDEISIEEGKLKDFEELENKRLRTEIGLKSNINK